MLRNQNGLILSDETVFIWTPCVNDAGWVYVGTAALGCPPCAARRVRLHAYCCCGGLLGGFCCPYPPLGGVLGLFPNPEEDEPNPLLLPKPLPG